MMFPPRTGQQESGSGSGSGAGGSKAQMFLTRVAPAQTEQSFSPQWQIPEYPQVHFSTHVPQASRAELQMPASLQVPRHSTLIEPLQSLGSAELQQFTPWVLQAPAPSQLPAHIGP